MTTPVPDDLRVALYDAVNTWAADDDFFFETAAHGPGIRVLDLGCGTGRLTVALADEGFEVTGVDPDGTALAAARRKPGAESVRWIEGTSQAIPTTARFDVALMTAHVVQAIVDDTELRATLADLRASLVSGGLLAFDSRDPAARAWERWTPEASRTTSTLPDGSPADGWYEVTGVEGGVVHVVDHTVLPDGTHVTEVGDLAFRSEEVLRREVEAAGFVVSAIFGGWEREPVGAGVGELVVVARRA